MKYNPDLHPQLAGQYALDGLIDEEIAAKLNICRKTLHNWKNAYPAFAESLAINKQVVDYKAEQSLYRRVIGEEYEEVKEVYQLDKDGKETLVRREKTKKRVLPDTLACLAWLRNRQRDKWKGDPDKIQEHDEGTLNDLVESLKNRNK